MSALRREPPLPANGCTRRSSGDGLISRNSRPARSASASSTGRSCRRCSDRRKSRAGRNSASRHRTRNIVGLDRYTKGAGCGAPCAKPKLSGRKAEWCYSVADDSPAGSRIRASVAPAVYEPAQPARRPAAATGRQQSTETRGATSAHHRRPAIERRFKSECTVQRSCFRFTCETTALRRLAKLCAPQLSYPYLISLRPKPARETSPLPARSCRGSCRRPCRRSSMSRR